jgi:hypothetical protein
MNASMCVYVGPPSFLTFRWQLDWENTVLKNGQPWVMPVTTYHEGEGWNKRRKDYNCKAWTRQYGHNIIWTFQFTLQVKYRILEVFYTYFCIDLTIIELKSNN